MVDSNLKTAPEAASAKNLLVIRRELWNNKTKQNQQQALPLIKYHAEIAPRIMQAVLDTEYQ